METITIRRGAETQAVTAARGESLLCVLQAAGAVLTAPCGGGHTCGKCFVKAQGALSPMTEREQALLQGREPGVRLACFATVEGPCTVEVAPQGDGRVVTLGTGPTAAGHEPLFDGGYGVAVDIGTTTLAVYLFSREGGQPLAVAGEFSRQQQYGADVMTRIAFDNEDPGYVLRDLIRSQLSEMMTALCHQAGVAPAEVSAAVLTGNTTMLHLLAGLRTKTLAMAPYTPLDLFGSWWDFTLPGFPDTRCYLPRCISAYVGADITCGILASGMLREEGNLLLVDIGTNGEMALKTGDKLLCCSTAAGPAFEGAGISCGSGATVGAISKVTVADGTLAWQAIGGGEGTSLCGSGLIDAVAACLALGYFTPAGRVQKQLGGSIPFPGSSVTLTQKDIRQVQLAKGAIRAGIDTMLHHCDLTYEALDRVILCGGFGSYLSPASAEAIGMLPPGAADKVQVIGNAAGSGAAALLLDRGAAAEAEEIARKALCIELSADKYFMQQFIAQLNF